MVQCCFKEQLVNRNRKAKIMIKYLLFCLINAGNDNVANVFFALRSLPFLLANLNSQQKFNCIVCFLNYTEMLKGTILSLNL